MPKATKDTSLQLVRPLRSNLEVAIALSRNLNELHQPSANMPVPFEALLPYGIMIGVSDQPQN